jgi:hypothetical protein
VTLTLTGLVQFTGEGTLTVMVVSLTMVKPGALVEPKDTAVVPVKFVPVSVIKVPIEAELRLRLVTVGAEI